MSTAAETAPSMPPSPPSPTTPVVGIVVTAPIVASPPPRASGVAGNGASGTTMSAPPTSPTSPVAPNDATHVVCIAATVRRDDAGDVAVPPRRPSGIGSTAATRATQTATPRLASPVQGRLSNALTAVVGPRYGDLKLRSEGVR
jgi:hypothetical protein